MEWTHYELNQVYSQVPDLWFAGHMSVLFVCSSNRSGVYWQLFPRLENSPANQSYVGRIKNGEVIQLCQSQEKNGLFKITTFVGEMWFSVYSKKSFGDGDVICSRPNIQNIPL